MPIKTNVGGSNKEVTGLRVNVGGAGEGGY